MDIHPDPNDWGARIQAAAERHLNAVSDAEFELENDPDSKALSPAVGPWCGCSTCLVREVLAGAWPEIESYFALRVTEGVTP